MEDKTLQEFIQKTNELNIKLYLKNRLTSTSYNYFTKNIILLLSDLSVELTSPFKLCKKNLVTIMYVIIASMVNIDIGSRCNILTIIINLFR